MNQPFLFIFYKKSGLIANLIKRFTGGKYSHVAMTLEDGFHTIELSWKTRTSIRHYSYQKGTFDLYELNIELSDEQKRKITEFILNNISTGYDFPYIVTRGLSLLFGTKIINTISKYNCDELLVDAFLYANINLLEGINEILTPDVLARSKFLIKQ